MAARLFLWWFVVKHDLINYYPQLNISTFQTSSKLIKCKVTRRLPAFKHSNFEQPLALYRVSTKYKLEYKTL